MKHICSFIISLSATLIGILITFCYERKKSRKKQEKQWQSLFGESGPFYDARDWAGSIINKNEFVGRVPRPEEFILISSFAPEDIKPAVFKIVESIYTLQEELSKKDPSQKYIDLAAKQLRGYAKEIIRKLKSPFKKHDEEAKPINNLHIAEDMTQPLETKEKKTTQPSIIRKT